MLNHDRRTLMGPGPSDVSPRVMRALATPVLGHLDPLYLALMDRVQQQLRDVFQTRNALTLALPGTGTSGMEACLANLLEPGNTVVVGVCGYFGERLAEIATRTGARVVRVAADWGRSIPPAAVRDAIERERPQVVALVHAETSTGVLQPVDEIAAAARTAGALTVLDTVTSLGAVPVEIDRWGIDAAYSCTQKGLGCLAGLAPVTLSPRAVERIGRRKAAPTTFYLDLALLAKYWGSERVYHHTASSSLLFALHEALSIVLDEGLSVRFERHLRHHRALLAGLQALGLDLVTDPAHRLPNLHAVRVPHGVDEALVRRELLSRHGIEIGAGLGPFKGQVWRVGLMGESSSANHVLLFLGALTSVLARHGVARPGAVEAAAAVLNAG